MRDRGESTPRSRFSLFLLIGDWETTGDESGYSLRSSPFFFRERGRRVKAWAQKGAKKKSGRGRGERASH